MRWFTNNRTDMPFRAPFFFFFLANNSPTRILPDMVLSHISVCRLHDHPGTEDGAPLPLGHEGTPSRQPRSDRLFPSQR
jgi:hypothetical protein